MKELLRVTCKGARRSLGGSNARGAIDQSVSVSESSEDKRVRQLQRRKNPSCISNKSGSKTSGQAKSDDPKVQKSELAAETEESQEASQNNIESANQS